MFDATRASLAVRMLRGVMYWQGVGVRWLVVGRAQAECTAGGGGGGEVA